MNNPDQKRDEGHELKEQFAIIVNGRKKDVQEEQISFDQVVILAFGQMKPNTAYTVTYKDGPKENPQGSMSAGDKVDVKNGMIFNVTESDKS